MDHKCQFVRLQDPICKFHKVDCLYRCTVCNRFHVCNGGNSCLVINTGENMVCVLTGSCIMETVQDTRFCISASDTCRATTDHKYVFNNIVLSIMSDIAYFFSSSISLKEVSQAIFIHGNLKPTICALIESTFDICQHLFQDIPYAYSLVCSMYIHIIISIFSTKTVYGNVLFKCTKNKRFDNLVKQIREIWMSTLTTLNTDCPPGST